MDTVDEPRTLSEPAPDVVGLLRDLTAMLLGSSYEGTFRCEAMVARVAERFGCTAEVSFLADTAVLTVDDRTYVFAAEPEVPPLDRVTALKRVLSEIEDGRLTAAQARARFAELRSRPPRWSKPWQVLGLVLFAVGFGISVQSTWQEVAVSAAAGLVAGLLVIGSQHRRYLTLIAPLAASVLVSAMVLLLVEHGAVRGGPILLMVPALFYFIPGDALSAAMVELVDGRITAGAARLVYAMVLLLVLAFGAFAATYLVGVPASVLFETPVEGNLGPFLVWGGWVLFALGLMFAFSMDPRDFGWALLLVLLTAAVAQLGTRAFGEIIGTYLGAVAMVVTAVLLGRRAAGPPAYVLYLGAFYVLTPGSHGLRGLESWIGGDRIEGVTDLAGMLGMLTAVALGMLTGGVLLAGAGQASRRA